MYAMVGILLGLWAHLCRWDEDLFLPLMSLRLQTIWTLLPQRPTKKVVYMKRVLFIFIVLFQLRTVCRQPQPTYSFTSKSFTTHHRIPPISLQVHDCNDACLCHLLSPNWREAFWSHFIIFEIKWIKILKLLKDERRSLILADPMASRKCRRETLKAKVRLLFRWLKPLNCMVAFCDQHGMRGR